MEKEENANMRCESKPELAPARGAGKWRMVPSVGIAEWNVVGKAMFLYCRPGVEGAPDTSRLLF